jgi:hypothetical protein
MSSHQIEFFGRRKAVYRRWLLTAVAAKSDARWFSVPCELSEIIASSAERELRAFIEIIGVGECKLDCAVPVAEAFRLLKELHRRRN